MTSGSKSGEMARVLRLLLKQEIVDSMLVEIGCGDIVRGAVELIGTGKIQVGVGV